MANQTACSLQGSKEKNKKNSYRAFNNTQQRKLQTNCKQKLLLFLYIVTRHCSLIAYCVQWISHLLLWLEWMKLRPFPYMAGPFNHQGANEQWNFTGFLGLQCPLLYEISFLSECSLLGFWPNFLLPSPFRGCVESQTERASFWQQAAHCEFWVTQGNQTDLH